MNIMNLNVQKTPDLSPNETSAPITFPFSKVNNHHVAYVKNLDVLFSLLIHAKITTNPSPDTVGSSQDIPRLLPLLTPPLLLPLSRSLSPVMCLFQ